MVNNLGVDPEEWFSGKENPITDECVPCSVENNNEESVGISPPTPRKLQTDDWFENPLDKMPIATDSEDTLHEKMYQIATAKYNPFAVGGSENIGGSEKMLDR
jgi:hypothetical protein